MKNRSRNNFGAAINKAVSQAPLIKECRAQGHQWEALAEPVTLDDSVLDVKCSHCGTLGNRAREAKGDA
ncbi:hypothetical protein LCGC14_1069950 [marine sediment metagenome]|uniref:Uncharacterized protein n=2 Tax=marine sediment metagenome TaxID=412755 RepID=A0A0F9Q1K3_9ZZZZ